MGKRGPKPTGVNYPIVINVRVTAEHGEAFEQLLKRLNLADFAPRKTGRENWAKGELARCLLQGAILRAAEQPGYDALEQHLATRLGLLFPPADQPSPERSEARQGEISLRSRRPRVQSYATGYRPMGAHPDA